MKGIGCCTPATKCFRPDVIHAVGSAEDTVNCWFWGSSGIPPRMTPLKSSKYTLGSSWNLIVAGKKNNLTATYQNWDFFVVWVGEERQCRQQHSMNTPVCDNGTSKTTASAEQGWRGTVSSSCATAWCWHTFPRQQQHPGATAMTISLLSPTALTM